MPIHEPSTALLRGGPVNGHVLKIEPGHKTITLRSIYHAGSGADEKTPTYVVTDEIDEEHVVFAYQSDRP